MMKRLLAFFVVVAWAAIVAVPADAQYRDPRSPRNQYTPRPTVSPYLNLLRDGGSAGFNYQTLVRPELQFQNELQNERIRSEEGRRRQQQFNQQQQREISGLQRQQQELVTSPFTLPFADRATGAALSMRPTGQGRQTNYAGSITGHNSSRMRLQRSDGTSYFLESTRRRQR